ncbi:hypothetical protein SAMN05444166_0709 [Singulisphaera sp. GP187]|nr:hypothetical protein SAMN05444166_0709 [Singulisphaera sp. GP187]
MVGGFFFEYRALPQLRGIDTPIPSVFFHWEGLPGEEGWVDLVTPAPLLFAGLNVAILGLLAAWASVPRQLAAPGACPSPLESRKKKGGQGQQGARAAQRESL